MELAISIKAAPAVVFGNAPAAATGDGFEISLGMAVTYESLSRVLNGLLSGRRFEISEGLLARHVVVQGAALSADDAGNLLVQVWFSGSFNGTVRLKGNPVYDAASQTLGIAGLAYDLQTASFLLQTAKWLFSNKIKNELAKRTRFPLTPYLEKARAAVQEGLNKEWAGGIETAGKVGDLTLQEITALPGHLSIKSSCTGTVVIKVKNLPF